jgi:hypothetical protein
MIALAAYHSSVPEFDSSIHISDWLKKTPPLSRKRGSCLKPPLKLCRHFFLFFYYCLCGRASGWFIFTLQVCGQVKASHIKQII